MIDVTKMVATAAQHPEVKKAVRSLRNAGVGDVITAIGLVPKLSMAVIPGVFAAGAVFGAAAALVFTPRTREALKKDVTELFESVRSKAQESYGAATPAMS